ncbi:MAG: polymer-forming cytoskeletal protein [Acidaminococcaceae bacterium]
MFSWKWKEDKEEAVAEEATPTKVENVEPPVQLEQSATIITQPATPVKPIIKQVTTKETIKGDMKMTDENLDSKNDYNAVLEKIKAEKDAVAKHKTGAQSLADYEVIISKNTSINGNININGKTRIDGNIDGNINVDSDLLVGETGVIKATVSVKNAIICGTIEGNIICRGRLQLESTARVIGDIKTNILVVLEGAVLRGNCSEIEVEEIAEATPATSATAPVVEVPADYVW